MVGSWVERFVLEARRRRYLILESGSAPTVVLLTVGTLAFRVLGGVGQGGLGGGQGRGSRAEAGVVGQRSGRGGGFLRTGVESAMGGMRFFGPTGRDQTYVPQGEPTSRQGGGAQGGERSAGVPGAGVGRVQGGGVESDEQGGVEEPLPPGSVLSQRDQALGALKALVLVLGPEKGSQVMGLVEGLLPQEPASPVPATPTHAEMVARLHELHDSEKKVSKRVEEAKGGGGRGKDG